MGYCARPSWGWPVQAHSPLPHVISNWQSPAANSCILMLMTTTRHFAAASEHCCWPCQNMALTVECLHYSSPCQKAFPLLIRLPP